MSYHGDFLANSTFDIKFTTIDAGIPTMITGGAVIVAYQDNSTTETMSGLVFTANFDGITGLNNIRVTATGSAYPAGSNYSLIIATGTIGGKSASGYVIGSFSIEARAGIYNAAGIRSAVGLASANLDTQFSNIPSAVWSAVIETGYTAKNAFRLVLSSVAAKLSGAATTNVKIRDINDAKDRIDATVDSDGNRTSVTYDVSD